MLRATFLQARKEIKHLGQTVSPPTIAKAHLTETPEHQIIFNAHGAEEFTFLGHKGDAQHHAFFECEFFDGLTLEFDPSLAG